MDTQFKIPHIQIQGDAFTRGKQYGAQASVQVHHSLSVYREIFLDYAAWDWQTAREYAATYQQVIDSYRPHFIPEMRGIAEGAGVDFLDILALNLRTEIRNFAIARSVAKECTAFVTLPEATTGGHTLIGQNWDWFPKVSDSIVILEVHPDHIPSFVTVVEAGLLAKTGFNSAGIGLVTNALHADIEKGEPGVPYHLVLRAILEAETFSDALGAITSHARASAANYLIAHQDGEAFNAEAAPGDYSRVYVTFPTDNIAVHTNHYLCQVRDFKDIGLWSTPDSLIRHQRLHKFLTTNQGAITVAGVQKVLADHFNYPNSVCCHPDIRLPKAEWFASIFSVIMDLTIGEMWLAPGSPCQVDFQNFKFSW